MWGILSGTGSKRLGTERIRTEQGALKDGTEGLKKKRKKTKSPPVAKIKGL